MSRTDKIPSLEEARQARAEDVRNSLATVASRARTLGITDDAWQDAADVLDELMLALGAGDHEALATLAKMAERARKADSKRQAAYGTDHRRELCAALQAWDGQTPSPEAMAEWFLDRARNLALRLLPKEKAALQTAGLVVLPEDHQEQPCVESYLPKDVIKGVARALERGFQRVREEEHKGKVLVAAGLNALGVDLTTANNALDQRVRNKRQTLDR